MNQVGRIGPHSLIGPPPTVGRRHSLVEPRHLTDADRARDHRDRLAVTDTHFSGMQTAGTNSQGSANAATPSQPLRH